MRLLRVGNLGMGGFEGEDDEEEEDEGEDEDEDEDEESRRLIRCHREDLKGRSHAWNLVS